MSGVIVTAAADQRVLANPHHVAGTVTGWMALGGTALFLAGHVLSKVEVWRVVPWTRIGAVVVLLLLILLAPHLPALWLGALGCLVILGVSCWTGGGQRVSESPSAPVRGDRSAAG